ncbi:T9SS type A sorting domain-containing protein [bacterium]|nr:T9SS type A sorting domain-containing protein [bacterium]
MKNRFCAWLAWGLICGGLTTTSFAGVVVESLDPARNTVIWTLADLRLEPGLVGDVPVVAVDAAGTLPRQEAGRPELPTATVTLEIPGRGTPAFRIVSRRERAVPTPLVRPSLGHLTRDRDPGALVPEFGPVYTAGAVFPASEVELGRPFLLGDRRGVTVRLNPVRWDAARGVLLVTDALTLEIVTSGDGGENALPADAPASSAEFRAGQSRTFANVADRPLMQKSAPLARGRMLIVSHDDFVPELASFRAWKARRGIASDVLPLSATDGTAAGLRKAIADAYLDTPGLTWVVLVGDREQLPTNTGVYDGSDSDTRYGMILGDDLYPEVHVSRVSVRTPAEAAVQLAKFVAYEANPATGGAATWYARAAGVASDEGVPADYERAELLRSDLLTRDYTAVDRIYQSLGASSGSIATALNEGRSLVNYLGHGTGLGWQSVPFDRTNVAALTNTGRLPWIIDVSCSNGDFALDTCFAEAWLRAGTAAAPAGAVGMVAASSLAPWTPPTIMQGEIVDLLTAGATYEMGALVTAGLVRVLDEYAGVPVATQVMEQNILFGDASLQVRTRAPAAFDVVLPAVVLAGDDQLEVQVGAAGTGTVAVSAGATLLGAADFTAAGTVRVPVSGLGGPAGPAEVTVTVTGPNMIPATAVVPVVSGATPVPDVVTAAPELRGNYPNPFNPVTRIRFELPAAGRVQLAVYDVAGRVVRHLADEGFAAGSHEVTWDGRDAAGRAAPSGLYLYRLEAAGHALTGRMTLAK